MKKIKPFISKLLIVILAGSVLIWTGERLFAQPKDGKDLKTPGQNPVQNPNFTHEQAIRGSADEFTAAFNRNDAKAIGALLTADCDYTDGVGNVYHGRGEIEKEYTEFFAQNPKAKIKINITSIRRPGPDTAIEDGTATVTLANGPSSTVLYRVVHLRQNGQWLMTSIRDSVDETTTHYADLQDLDWLIGNWVAKGNDREVHTAFKWMDNKNFLQRMYTVKTKDGVVASGMQIIGWDPAVQAVTSWTFDSTGGYGHGVWRPIANGWSITSTGVMPDGTPVSSTEITTRIDDNHFTWQSVNRMAEESPLPDTEKIVVERVKEKNNRQGM